MSWFVPVITLIFAVAPDLYAESEFEKWKRGQTQQFQSFKEQRDKDFTAFLKQQWRPFKMKAGVLEDKEPKPVVMPVAKPQSEPVIIPPPLQPKPVQTKPVQTKPEQAQPEQAQPEQAQPEQAQPEQAQPEQAKPKKIALVQSPKRVVVRPPKPLPVKVPPKVFKPSQPTITVNYYDTHLNFKYSEEMGEGISAKVDKNVISDYWSRVSRSDYEPILAELLETKNRLSLNDWAYTQLVQKVATRIVNTKQNEQVLLSWFLLLKSGYNARIAYRDSDVYLLLPAKQPLYGVDYFTLDKDRYYAVTFNNKKQKLQQVFTYKANYPKADQLMDYTRHSAIKLADKSVVRRLQFSYQEKEYTIPIDINANKIAFYADYPEMGVPIYLNSATDEKISRQLLQKLRPLVKGRDELDAVNLLLRFVQTAFEYQTDDQQFGSENPLFLMETLYYPASDCEDRSILFTWLVRNLLGLEVIGLDFPGHIATAVRFSQEVDGDAVNYRNGRYVVTDPTYINASAGMTMPQFKGVKPKVIPTGLRL